LRTLYVGETNPKDTKYYYELDESAYNLDIENYETALEEKLTGVFYTSVSDFQNNFNIMLQVCWNFDKVTYRPPNVWSALSVGEVTSQFLRLLSWFKSIENFIIDFTRRKTEEPQIWVAGCSWSSAVGVAKEQRWGNLLADQMNMAVTVLAEGGSGNSYQARKLLSADIRENDVVIFQVTSPHRETIVDPKYGQIHVNAQTYTQRPDLYKRYPPDRLDETTLVANQIRDIQNVVNFLQKIKARFMLWAPNTLHAPGTIGGFLEKNPLYSRYFCVCSNHPVDTGADGAHPGPKTHKLYSDFVFEKIKQ
jgi:hypothetical protein